MTTEAEFRRAVLPFTLAREGGLSVRPDDPGNWTGGAVGRGRLVGTKYGIAASAHPTLDIRHLTIEEAGAIYWSDYVVRPGFAELPLPLLLVVFDAGVNCGPRRARLWLDAVPADATVGAAVGIVTDRNIAFHRRLKTWPTFGRGWSARIAACREQALRLAAVSPTAVAVRSPMPFRESPRAVPRAADNPPAGVLARLLCWLIDHLVPSLAPART